jgi:hypothetical protein
LLNKKIRDVKLPGAKLWATTNVSSGKIRQAFPHVFSSGGSTGEMLEQLLKEQNV